MVFKQKIFEDWKLMNMCLARTAFGVITVLMINVGSKLVTLSVFSVITRLQTIILTFLGIYFLGNKFDYRIILAAGISLIGVILVVAPSLFGLSPGKNGGLELKWTFSEVVGVVCAFIYSITDSCAYIVLTIAAGKASMVQAVIALNIGISLSNGLILMASGQSLQLYWEDAPYYLMIIVGYYLGQVFFTISAKCEPHVGVQAVIQSTFVIFSLLIDVFLMGNAVSIPNYIGCALVTGSSIWAVLLRTV